MAAFLMGYSAFTKYEFGIVRRLPMRGHLVFDAMGGLLMTVSPAFLRTRSPFVNSILIGLGLYEIAASITTESDEPPTPVQQPVADEFEIPINVREFVKNQ